MTLAANSRGRPWTENGLRNAVRKVIARLEGEVKVGLGLTIHGLRHTVAVRMRELGFDERTIADALGQASGGMALHYARGADLRAKMMGVVQRLDDHRNKEAPKPVKPRA